jgi:hypothetical protein
VWPALVRLFGEGIVWGLRVWHVGGLLEVREFGGAYLPPCGGERKIEGLGERKPPKLLIFQEGGKVQLVLT